MDVVDAVGRAKSVIEGFKTPTERLAHDVVRLAKELEAKKRENDDLRRKLMAVELMSAATANKTKKGDYEGYDYLRSVFGAK
jgi:regulator of replication initiation timing